MFSARELGFPGPEDLSPSEEWVYAHEIERESRKDDWRVVGFRIDLEEPADQEANDEWVAELRRSVRLAQERIGRSDEERVRWFLRFASLNEANLSEEERRRLESEVLAFTVSPLAHSVLCEVQLSEGDPRLVSLNVLELHRWAKSGLLTQGESARPPVWTIDAHVSHHFTWLDKRLVPEPPADEVLAEGDLTSDRFKAQVGNLLAGQGHRVRL